MKLKLSGDMNECPSCKKVFADVESFDAHRTGPIEQRRCMNSREMRGAGMTQRMADGVWRKV
jgi:hypothetical protein